MRLKNKKVLVYGLGESGKGAIKLLKKQKAKIFVYDDNADVLSVVNDDKILKIEAITENFLKELDLIVLNPSVSIYSENIILANMLNVKIISEIELAYQFCKGKIVSVTGSNGKTTTSSLIYNIFKNANIKCSLVGNIGTSFCGEISKNNKQSFIVEVSSFQLETIDKFRSNTACFLNFSENHLDRHFSLKEYFNTKLKIFKNSKKRDYKILNFEDEKVKNIKLNTNTYYFGLTEGIKGTYIKEGYIYFNNLKTEERVVALSDIKLIGAHNIMNVLCAVLVAKLNRIDNKTIQQSVSSFYGINHRIEFVETINNIKFYNDSKSTTVKSTQTAINCFEEDNIALIVGGSDKGFEFTELFCSLSKNVKLIVAIGEVRDKILKEAKDFNFSNIFAFDDFDLAINSSYFLAKENNCNVVLLSPATASFDMFKNFEHRGERFKQIVEEIKSENQV